MVNYLILIYLKGISMKRIAIVFLIILAGMSSVSAADVSLGLTTWYAEWIFDDENSDDKTEMDPVFLYGPVAAVKLSESLSLTGLFLYGVFEMEQGDGETGDVKRYDADIALNYNITRYVKFFGGVKTMAYTFSGGHHISTGPAAGVGATIPLFDSVYFLFNISAMYTWGEHDDNDGTTDMNEYGVNTGGSLAYYYSPWAVTAALGGRYQYFKSDSDGTGGDMDHTFRGITASIIKSF